jgi:hypothetical protein
LHANTDKPLLHSIVLHLQIASDSYEHFFNPYINLHLEDFDFFPNASTCTFVVNFHSELFTFVPLHVPLLILDPSFYYNFHVVSSASFPFV